MIYYGYFRNTNTEVDSEGQLYFVYITSSFNSGDNEEEKELLFAENPFTVEYESGEDIYKPYKCSTATIRLLNTEFDPNLNAISALDVSVRLYKVIGKGELELEWAGYTIPNAYSQDYNSFYDSFELECQDCLSALKYQDCDITREDGLFTVEDYLRKILAQTDFIEHLYISDNIRVPLISTDPRDGRENQGKSPIASNILLENIFKKSDPDSDEKYRNSLEVLEDICTILNLTAIQKGNSIYLISYDAVAYEYSSYTHYDVNFNKDKKTINSKYELVKSDSAANDTSISLDSVYGEFSVTTSSDYVEYEFPKLSDWTTRLKSYVDNLDFTAFQGCYNPLLTYNSILEVNNSDEPLELQGGAVLTYWKWILVGGTLQPTLLSVFNYNTFAINPNIYEDERIVRVNGYCYDINYGRKNDYDFGNLRVLDPIQQAGVYNGKDYIVATPIGVSKWSGNVTDLAAEGGLSVVAGEKLDYGYKIFHNVDVASLDLRVENDRAAYKSYALSEGYNASLKMLEFKIPDVALSHNDYIVLNMDVEYDLDLFSDLVEDSGNVYVEKDMAFIWAEISFTDYEGNRKLFRDGEWIDDDNHTHITKIWLDVDWFDATSQNREKTTHAFWNKIGLKNTVKVKYGLDEDVKGFAIPSPVEKGGLKGEIKITICRPWGATSFVQTVSTTITDPSIKVYASGTAVRDGKELTYKHKTNVNSDKLERTINISSYTGTANNRNILYSLDIDSMLNPFTKNIELIQNLVTGDVMKPEEMLLAAYRRQYSTKTVILNTSVHNDEVSMISKVSYHRFPDKKFIVDGLTIDYGYDIKTLKLVEKK